MASESNPSPERNNKPHIEEDLNLVKSISAGSLPAWHEFIDRYSGLIYGVVRRHLFSEDEDEVRSVYVDILKAFYDGEISKYRGESLLSTWLIVFTRRRALDFFRSRYGRYRPPEGYDKLSEFDKKVLQLYFVEKLPLEIVVHALQWRDFRANVDDIVESIQHINDVIDRRYLNRIESERAAKAYGMESVRMLKYLIQLRLDYEESAFRNRTDVCLIEDELHETANRLRTLIGNLTPEERKVIFLRFNRGWPASRIAEKLNMNGQRRVYSLIDKIIKKLKEAMVAEGDI